MTTLIGDELFEYIEHLQGEVDKRISTNQEGSLSYLMHSQMRDIVIAERDFLKYINSNGTQPILSISPNGLPSVNSLNAALEKICELAENKSSFSDITQKFRKGIHGKNKEEGNIYTSVSEQDRNKEKLNSQIGFAFSETDEGKFELALREDFYLQVYDQHSKEFPVLIREGKMNYHVVWNKLIDNSEENFYVPNTALVLSNNGLQQQTIPSNLIGMKEYFSRECDDVFTSGNIEDYDSNSQKKIIIGQVSKLLAQKKSQCQFAVDGIRLNFVQKRPNKNRFLFWINNDLETECAGYYSNSPFVITITSRKFSEDIEKILQEISQQLGSDIICKKSYSLKDENVKFSDDDF